MKNHKLLNQPFFNITLWNIEGLTDFKSSDDDFHNILSKSHILNLVETWKDKENNPVNLPEFELVSSSSRKRHKKARRNSGGIAVYAKKHNCQRHKASMQ